MVKELLDVLMELRAQGKPYAVATVVETAGSVSAKTGSKAVIDAEGRVIAGWVGGGCAESTTCDQAQKCIQTGETAIVDIDLDDEILGAGMPCGGSMRVYVEPVLPKPTLWIMGHGRVAESLCILGDLMGLNVVVNDAIVDSEKYPNTTRLITDDLDYEQLDPLPGDYVVVATQHKGDHESMSKALRSKAGYIALVASRKRSRLVMEYLAKEGFSAAELERVMAPSGLDLGARSPEEIALCVMSEIVLTRRHGSGMRMRDKVQLEAEQAKNKAE
ncbi:MAG: XshC-Cox1-family protein [Betaproteobacteria bacterium HGW-Betaproteobacteria-11]|nr:MAG: XshC-Cox1-family protein [Betaproteobacteria bacterium HGW-Betaproteobacteria-11]